VSGVSFFRRIAENALTRESQFVSRYTGSLVRFTNDASQSAPKEATMAVMCSLAACKAQAGMCGHEKVMLSVAMLAAIGLGAYFLIG
jgi:hypothetical protein